MTTQKVRELLDAMPFVPFSLRLADGHQIQVVHPDYVALSPTGRLACVFHGDGDASSFVDVLLVTAIETNPAGAATNGGTKAI